MKMLIALVSLASGVALADSVVCQTYTNPSTGQSITYCTTLET